MTMRTGTRTGSRKRTRRDACRQVLAALLAGSVALSAPAALAQDMSRAEAAAIARSRAGGGTVLKVRSTRANGVLVYRVKLLNPQGQIVTIKVSSKR